MCRTATSVMSTVMTTVMATVMSTVMSTADMPIIGDTEETTVVITTATMATMVIKASNQANDKEQSKYTQEIGGIAIA